MSKQVKTLAEHLKDPEIAAAVLSEVTFWLRAKGEWGKFGLFKKIADKTGFSAGYVGRMLTGKQRLTADFVNAVGREYGFLITINEEEGGSAVSSEALREKPSADEAPSEGADFLNDLERLIEETKAHQKKRKPKKGETDSERLEREMHDFLDGMATLVKKWSTRKE